MCPDNLVEIFFKKEKSRSEGGKILHPRGTARVRRILNANQNYCIGKYINGYFSLIAISYLFSDFIVHQITEIISTAS